MVFKKSKAVSLLLVLVVFFACSRYPTDLTDYADGSARFMIPNNATIISAELFVFAYYVTDVDPIVNLHRITAPWEENTVTWNSFNGAFDPAVIDSQVISQNGWYAFDIKPLIMGWITKEYPMYGLLLDQDLVSGAVYYRSKEHELTATLPYLKLVLSINNELLEEDPELPVADTFIWEINPDMNYGSHDTLYTGVIQLEKQSLFNFSFEEETYDVGTGTPGYWKNHPEAWPLDEIVIGGIQVYSKEEAIELLSMPIKKDKWFTMFKAYTAAVLNVAAGADASPIASTLTAADHWLLYNFSVVRANEPEWKYEGEFLYLLLDDYNNGFLGVPSRDLLE